MQISFDDEGADKVNALDEAVFKIKQEYGRGALKTAKELATEAHLSKE